MRKVVVMMSVSVDGCIEGPNKEIDWHLVDEELHAYFNEQLGAMGAFLEGRVTYELMAAYWPTADADPDAPAVIRDFARIWREMPKVVYSSTLTSGDELTTVLREVVPEEVRRLKEQEGGDLVVGGADLAAAFRRHGLIDEYWLFVHPVVLGAGKPLFPRSEERIPLQLLDTRRFGNGVVMLRYSVLADVDDRRT